MKKLMFDYEMRLSFSAPVTDHRFQLRCIPSTGPRQQVIDVEVKIQPETELETTIDSFDSVVMTGFIPEPHDIFSYSVTGIAFVDNAHIHKEAYKPLYRFNSALTIPGPNVEAMIAVCRERLAALPSDATPVQQAAEVMDEVYKAFVYTPGSTTIRTTAEQALAQRKGVCQDVCARDAVRVPACGIDRALHCRFAWGRGRDPCLGRGVSGWPMGRTGSHA